MQNSLQMDRIRSIRRSKEISDGEASIAEIQNWTMEESGLERPGRANFADAKTGLETLKSGIEQMENALNASQTGTGCFR